MNFIFFAALLGLCSATYEWKTDENGVRPLKIEYERKYMDAIQDADIFKNV